MPHPVLIVAALGGIAAWANRLRGDPTITDDPSMFDLTSGREDDRRSLSDKRTLAYPPANPFDTASAPQNRPAAPPSGLIPKPAPVAAPAAAPAAALPSSVIDPSRCPPIKQWPAQECQNPNDWRSTGRGGASQFKRSYFGKEPPMSTSLGSTHYSHLGGVASFGKRPSTVVLPGGREVFMDEPKEKGKKVSLMVALKKGGWKKMEQRAVARAVKVLESQGYEVDTVLQTTLIIIPVTPIGPVPFLYKGWAVAKVVAKATYYED